MTEDGNLQRHDFRLVYQGIGGTQKRSKFAVTRPILNLNLVFLKAVQESLIFRRSRRKNKQVSC